MIKPILVKPLHDGIQALYRFDNGYGASVVRHPHSYGHSAHLAELAVLKFSGPGLGDFDLCYDTPIADDVMGHLDPEEVNQTLEAIRDLGGTPAITQAELAKLLG